MDGMPKLDEHHQRIQRLAGQWVGDEQLSPSPWSPGGKRSGRYDNRTICGGFFVTGDYVQLDLDGKIAYEGHSVFGVDPHTHEVSWYWVDSMGMPSLPSLGRWDGDTLTLLGKKPDGSVHGRYTWTFSDGGKRLRFKLENTQDAGKTWATFMEGNYLKTI